MNTPPLWVRLLFRTLAPRGEADDVLGDLQEAHALRKQSHGRLRAHALTTLETFDMAGALMRARFDRMRANKGNIIVQDYKLGFRMLAKYPGLSIAGGLALALAIGIGAGWYDLSAELFRPAIPLPNGDRMVEIEMRDAANPGDERRILHDFLIWREEVHSVQDIGAYRTLERSLVTGDARSEPVTVAETTASAFRVAGVPPLYGRPLIDEDERRGAQPVLVLGYDLWRQRFGGRTDALGETIRLGRTHATIVGVMPEGFTFPRNHQAWVPLQLQPSGYSPLEGVGIRVFGLISPGATQAQANVELGAITERVRQASPRTHQHLLPRVLAYGGESPGDRSVLEVVITHLPIILVLVIACMNVGTLIYARTATREGEIATRYALGASRGRIVFQLFVEALVLASVAAAAGLVAANWALKWGVNAYYSGGPGLMPFWIRPGLELTSILYAAVITIVGAALLGVLPALKATGGHAQGQLRNLGTGGSTLRFGKFWTATMIGQVALTVICIPPAAGISEEAWRDRAIRDAFPAEHYLAAHIGLDRETTLTAAAEESAAAYARRFDQRYQEFARQIAREPGVVSVTYGDRLPGMAPALRTAEFEATPGGSPALIPTLWETSVGPGFFQAFDVPLLAGREFHDGDRGPGAKAVLVNEAFARRYLNGASPVGRRIRYASPDPSSTPEPWFEIVGMVRDVGMTPTDLGEAPYIYRAVAPASARTLVMGVRTAGDPAALAPRIRSLAAALDPAFRLEDVRTLDDHVRRVDMPMMISAGAIVAIVGLGLFLSAAGIFALMSVSVARRTREIGLRAALGASPRRLIAGVFTRALVLVSSGVAAGNAVLLLIVALSEEVELTVVAEALAATSAVMLLVGLLACAEPARRALRIQPTDALKEA